MKYLIRFVTRNPAGGVEHADKIVDAPVITIGRATDQVLHLRDRRARLQHAQIEASGTDVQISSSALTGVIVNGRSQRTSKLKVGDIVEVGANIITVIEPPDGIDFAISFELSSDASAENLVADWSVPVATLGGWSKRRLSWTFVVVVALFAFFVPFYISETLFLAGPIHSAHAPTASECGACHINTFERVPDSACEACHTPDRHVVRASTPVLGEIRCASCHLEHNEPQQLVNQHQALCGDCHAGSPPDASLASAGDFLDDHPEFRIGLLLPATLEDGSTEWNRTPMLLADAAGAEQSNLIFDHAVHLDAAGIVTPDGRRVIECSECHVPEPGGARMLPITMDEHCSSCHTLAFDPDDPSRTVPHGNPETVVQSLIEYYSARLLGADPDAVERRIRRPGQQLSRADRDRAAAEARVQALAVAEDLFERRACVNCHVVTKLDQNSDVPWQVEPVRLPDAYFISAHFSHASHDTDVTSCDSCHKASQSTSAQDVLIPDLESCRDCHGSGFARRNSASQLPSTCVMCHSFHFESKGPRP